MTSIIVTTVTAAFGLTAAGAAYVARIAPQQHYVSPYATSVLFSTVAIIALLLATGMSFKEYEPAAYLIIWLLGPSGIALTLPIYKNQHVLLSNLLPLGRSLVAGSIGPMIATKSA